jgi:hypothetical protein
VAWVLRAAWEVNAAVVELVAEDRGVVPMPTRLRREVADVGRRVVRFANSRQGYPIFKTRFAIAHVRS